jgi:serine phosphatase RsbU (regulator of sigma subunit)
VRIGTGFAGSVAAGRAPVVIDEITPQTVLNPILRESGVRSLLGVPVQTERRVLGVLHVGSKSDRVFGPTDVERLQALADEVADRLSVTTGADEHTAALALQRSLLPAVPPLIPGLDVAVRYLPSDGDLGGDWYDVFALPDGRVAFVMGDVQGHGLRSAVVMGRLRSALRAYALEHEDPAEVLQLLDRKLCHFENETLATVAFAVAAPPFDELRISLAGHPPPVVAEPGADAGEVAHVVTDILLGVAPDTVRKTQTIPLPVGSSVALHTDGLLDVRPGIAGHEDPYGYRLGRVCRALVPGIDAESACATVIAAALGDDDLQDDVALLVIRRTA